MPKHELITTGLLDASVCSTGTWDEALEWLRRTCPSGTENNWCKNEEKGYEPLSCADGGGRVHYMFTC